jgi:hypothetical protein
MKNIKNIGGFLTKFGIFNQVKKIKNDDFFQLFFSF